MKLQPTEGRLPKLDSTFFLTWHNIQYEHPLSLNIQVLGGCLRALLYEANPCFAEAEHKMLSFLANHSGKNTAEKLSVY